MITQINQYNIFKQKKIISLTLLKNQGYCNTNYLLKTVSQKYLIRKFKLKNDRKFEYKVQKMAYKKKIAAKPFLLDEENGLMICEFLEGFHKIKLARQDLSDLATILKKLHKIEIRQKPINLQNSFTSTSKNIKKAFHTLKRYKKEYVLCHNDLNPKNILFSNRVKLIDWEFSSINDRYFDLAAVCVEFNLSAKNENYFLRRYFSRGYKINHDKLSAYKRIYKALCLQWFDQWVESK